MTASQIEKKEQARLDKLMRELEKEPASPKKNKVKIKFKLSKDEKRLIRERKKYKEITGKRRLSKEEKSAISEFGAKRTAKRLDLGSETYERRVRAFEKKYGTATPEVLWALMYTGPKGALRYLPEEERPWLTFTEVDFPLITWEELPEEVRKNRGFIAGEPIGWEEFIYETRLYEDGNSKEPRIEWGLSRSEDTGKTREFADLIEKMLDGVLLDPGETGAFFWVYEKEWLNVAELDPDYTKNRRYRPINYIGV